MSPTTSAGELERLLIERHSEASSDESWNGALSGLGVVSARQFWVLAPGVRTPLGSGSSASLSAKVKVVWRVPFISSGGEGISCI